jgi:hypothetical protein
MPIMNPLSIILIAFAIALGATLVVGAAFFLLGRVIQRGKWLVPKERKSVGPVRGVLSMFQEIVQPEIRQMREEQRQRHEETDEQSPSDR